MAKQQQTTMSMRGGSGLTGFLVGLIVAVVVTIRAASAVAYATNPMTRYLFSGRLSETTPAGYAIFWGLVAAVLIALPFVVGWGVTELSNLGLAIIGGIVVVVVIVLIILGTTFVF